MPEKVDWRGYVDALLIDWNSQNEALQNEALKEKSSKPETNRSGITIASIFLGGGTPSLFEAPHFSHLLQSIPLAYNVEITMEANPGTTEHTNFSTYHAVGINRLSLGAQSFSDASLAKLGRIHSADETTIAFENARNGGFDNINIDLMWGLPQQTVDDALNDIRRAISLQPEHISWYQLTIEAKTEFAVRTPLLPKEQTLADIEKYGLELLGDAGYGRYEVSAFAKPGKACRHNINYWQFGDYVGIGAGAHGKLMNSAGQIWRYAKPHQPRVYLKNSQVTKNTLVDSQQLAVEFMMNALRLLDGVSFDQFTHTTGLAWKEIETTWLSLVEQGLVRADRCATTPTGLRYLDSVVGKFIN